MITKLSIAEALSDNSMLTLVTNWMQTDEWKENIASLPPSEPYLVTHAFNNFVELLSTYVIKEQDLTWENYCKIIHGTPRLYRYPRLLRKSFREFFKFASKEAKDQNVRTYLEQYSYLFIENEIYSNKNNRNTPFLEQTISNFPINSTPSEVLQVKVPSRGNEEIVTHNIFLGTDNPLMHELLESFINFKITADARWIHLMSRVCYSFFNASLSQAKISDITDFTEATFKSQVEYFNNLFLELKLEPSEKEINSFKFLVHFYIFLNDVHQKSNGKQLLLSSTFNKDVLLSKQVKSLNKDFQFVILNPLDSIPEFDKWILFNQGTKSNISHAVKKKRIDFTLIKNPQLRIDMKQYVWSTTFQPNGFPYSRFVTFLNATDDFYQSRTKLSHITDTDKLTFFSNEFLFFYYAKVVSDEKYSKSSQNNTIQAIRSFLKYHQDKYKISNIVIEQWRRKSSMNERGGVPFSPIDFEQIRDAFKESIRNEEDELLYIVFQLAMSTKIRTGNILSLKRDCIVSVDEQAGYGKIKYVHKTSHCEPVEEVLLLNHIRLIQKSIQYSQRAFECADERLKKYIFIGFSRLWNSQSRVSISLSRRYEHTFNSLIDNLYQEKRISKKYSFNSARDTYMNDVYEGVEDGHYSTLEATTLSGDSPKTVYKHYRKRNRIKRYLEAVNEVFLSSEEVCGTVLKDEKMVDESFAPIQNNAGICSAIECTKTGVEEDWFYKCLACTKFVTTCERIPIFEQRLENFKTKREESTSETEMNYYTGLIELYSAYLLEMYLKLEDKS
ncbi:hypothetical protein [Pelosinus propionicus]|uniref:Uncharacterized protein n=1 Tax=Pelosinus propionicus DSM 13327 TaxID=1123291 RepID=A0A1I4JUU6_9FIRM|nr:hypothetical protein [Pelosinus propionicus]SFL70312.1 hypothetical protein SAMN04490355_101439 [Pelosinus propionicus DSM 13327]